MDKQKLRELALNATPGRWEADLDCFDADDPSIEAGIFDSTRILFFWDQVSTDMSRESDVRCYVCGTRYAERQDYGCQDQVGLPHRFDEEELAEARKVNARDHREDV